MLRRDFHYAGVSALGILFLTTYQQAQALSLGDLSSADASSGLKAALGKGAEVAVALLGQQNGFLGNPKEPLLPLQWLFWDNKMGFWVTPKYALACLAT